MHRRRVVAISQYFLYDAFPSLQDAAAVAGIRDAIVAFHGKVSRAFPMESYVFDVVVQARARPVCVFACGWHGWLMAGFCRGVGGGNRFPLTPNPPLFHHPRTPSPLCSQGGSCQVIELNPFGAYMSSGAGLFNWERDYETLHGFNLDADQPPPIRGRAAD